MAPWTGRWRQDRRGFTLVDTGREIKAGYGDLIPELVEGLPAKYHRDSELTAEVAADRTTFDFDLSPN